MQQVRRLFRQFHPELYTVHLDVTNTTHITGVVHIFGKVPTASRELRLHMQGQTIDKVLLVGSTCQFSYLDDSDELVIDLGKEIHGDLNITIEFHYPLSDQMTGIYAAQTTDSGEPLTVITTQCQSHHAREIFPCIDEPEAKAIFQLILTHIKGHTALSNTDVVSETTSKHKQTTTFALTPKMSSYLFAFVTGPLSYTESKTKSGVRVRTYTTPERVKQTSFATSIATTLLEMYEAYFNIPYPLSKCDLVAIPDFAAGAMENWGLITYRETELLYDKKLSNLETKQAIVTITSHELAHMWFGNLVTMKWWDDLWLNEGFASFMETYMADKLYPQWRLWDQFVASSRERALKTDALIHTHPIVMRIKHPDEITAAFDAISYEKSAAIITMLHSWLGERAFRRGIRRYIETYAYGNSESKDLWTSLTSPEKDVASFMEPWVNQKGFPVVSVREQAPGKLEVSQHRFTYAQNRDKHTWPIPLFDGDTVLTTESLTLDSERWNIDTRLRGFFRTVYDRTLLNESNLLRLSAMSKLGRVTDAFESTKAGDSPLTDAFLLIRRLMPLSYQPLWELIAGDLGHVRSVFQTNANRPLFQLAYLKLAYPEIQRLGWSPKIEETHSDTLLRPLVLAFASYGQHKPTISRALRRFDEATDSASLPAHTRGIILATAARERNDTATLETLLRWYKTAPSDEIRHEIALALTSFSKPALTRNVLRLLQTTIVKQQDVVFWVLYLLSNAEARQQTWQWIQSEWNWLSQTLDGEVYYASFPYYIARNFASEDFLNEYLSFFASLRSNPLLVSSIEQGEETIRWQTEWYHREHEAVESALRLLID